MRPSARRQGAFDEDTDRVGYGHPECGHRGADDLLLIATGDARESTSFASSAGQLEVQTVASGLVNPWALAFLPDGRMLVTERPGRMRIVTPDGKLSPPLKGVPEVWAAGQGGLLDVALDRTSREQCTLYFCFAERDSGGGRTASRAQN